MANNNSKHVVSSANYWIFLQTWKKKKVISDWKLWYSLKSQTESIIQGEIEGTTFILLIAQFPLYYVS